MSEFTDASVRVWQFGPSFANAFPSQSALAEFTALFNTDHPRRLLAYWRSKCGENAIPLRDDLRPTEMKPLLERLSIWERCEDGRDNHIRLIGTLAAQMFGKDPSGQRVSEAFPPRWAELFSRSNVQLYDQARPLYIRYDLAPMGREHVVVEQLALPLRRNATEAELSIHAFARLPSELGQPIPEAVL